MAARLLAVEPGASMQWLGCLLRESCAEVVERESSLNWLLGDPRQSALKLATEWNCAGLLVVSSCLFQELSTVFSGHRVTLC